MTDWHRVADAIERRRAVLFSSREEAADASGVAVTVWQQLERAKKDAYRKGTLARVEKALRWPAGTIDAIGEGGAPPMDGTTNGQPATEISLHAKIDRLTDRDRSVIEAAVDRLLGEE